MKYTGSQFISLINCKHTVEKNVHALFIVSHLLKRLRNELALTKISVCEHVQVLNPRCVAAFSFNSLECIILSVLNNECRTCFSFTLLTISLFLRKPASWREIAEFSN